MTSVEQGPPRAGGGVPCGCRQGVVPLLGDERRDRPTRELSWWRLGSDFEPRAPAGVPKAGGSSAFRRSSPGGVELLGSGRLKLSGILAGDGSSYYQAALKPFFRRFQDVGRIRPNCIVRRERPVRRRFFQAMPITWILCHLMFVWCWASHSRGRRLPVTNGLQLTAPGEYKEPLLAGIQGRHLRWQGIPSICARNSWVEANLVTAQPRPDPSNQTYGQAWFGV